METSDWQLVIMVVLIVCIAAAPVIYDRWLR